MPASGEGSGGLVSLRPVSFVAVWEHSLITQRLPATPHQLGRWVSTDAQQMYAQQMYAQQM
ncbi:hypothetical protein [Rhodococcus sp. ACPA1]|uniref:hypothetical protein n=1 Tax=Rhodococcus sp. ACPA1 TaxID=2028572 RepID=UPI000BB100C1|nr:hypothetical protein [Rhodococcus sp. ACPA1]PBC51548.1 hypothetical protein CJ177_34210 [Rhodococcus sp. ACPA1]